MRFEGVGCESGTTKSTNGSGLKMKLRDFMVNSLPRVRSRKKQKQQLLLQQQKSRQNNGQVLNNVNFDENRNTYSQTSTNISDSSCLDPIYCQPAGFKRISTESIRSELEELKIEKSHRISSPHPININVIADPNDEESFCSKHISTSYGPGEVVLGLGGMCQSVPNETSLNLDLLSEAFNFNTVPKARSKIRTNPWCNPSTPTNSPASSPSPNSFCSSSPTPTESRLVRSCYSPAVSEMSTSNYSTGSDRGVHCTSSFSTIEKPLCVNPRLKPIRDISQQRAVNSIIYCEKEIKEIPEVLENTEPCHTVKNDSTGEEDHLEHRVSFEYEETLETLLENGKVKSDSFDSIKDLYEDNMADDESNFSLGSIGSGSLGDDFPVCDMTDSGHSSGRGSFLDDKSPMCYSVESEISDMNFHENFDHELDLGLGRTADCLSDCTSSMNSDSAWISPESSESSGETLTPISTWRHDSSERSLNEVKASLEEKVMRLRQEKLLVEEKIREAQEEDRIRAREKIRFQKQMTLHRKQMLLQTLQELKSKLEQQGTRLQTSYSAILNIQSRFASKTSPDFGSFTGLP